MVVVTKHSAKSIATHDIANALAGGLARLDQFIAETLVIPFGMIMG